MTEIPQIARPVRLIWHDYNGWDLKIVLEERTALGPLEPTPGDPLGLLSQEIVRGPKDRRLGVTWRAITFAMTGDAAGGPPQPREGTGALWLVTRDSPFLQFVKQTCSTKLEYVNAVWGNADAVIKKHGFKYPQHWRVSTMDMSLDVFSLGPPTVEIQ